MSSMFKKRAGRPSFKPNVPARAPKGDGARSRQSSVSSTNAPADQIPRNPRSSSGQRTAATQTKADSITGTPPADQAGNNANASSQTDSASHSSPRRQTPIRVTPVPVPIHRHVLSQHSPAPVTLAPHGLATHNPTPSSILAPAPVTPESMLTRAAGASGWKLQAASQAEETDTTSGQPAKKPPKRKSQAASQAEETDATSTQPAKKSRKRKTHATEPSQSPARKPRRKPQAEDAAAGANENTTTRRVRARSRTPSDAENQTMDLAKLKMSDLTRDLRVGKKFSRHDELRDRERQKKARHQVERLMGSTIQESTRDAAASATAGVTSTNGEPSQATSGSSETVAASVGPQFQIVDGQIVVDQSSLLMDRHAAAVAEQAGMEEIEEDDFTRRTNCGSYRTNSRLRGPNLWSTEDTEKFYDALAICGTDFEMISKMFPGRNRRHVKMKFNREERRNGDRITAAMVGKKKVKLSLETYQAHTGQTYIPVADIEAEQQALRDQHEAEQKRREAEQAEITRQKKEALFADESDADADAEPVPAPTTGKRGRGRKSIGAGAKRRRGV